MPAGGMRILFARVAGLQRKQIRLRPKGGRERIEAKSCVKLFGGLDNPLG
jgi:hypothetical protein